MPGLNWSWLIRQLNGCVFSPVGTPEFSRSDCGTISALSAEFAEGRRYLIRRLLISDA